MTTDADRVRAPGPPTVLLVEDDAEVRRFLRDALMQAGYHVLSAATGADGVALAGRTRGRIDLLVAEVGLPDMSGLRLGRAVVAAHPRVAALYISAHAEEAGRRRSAGPRGVLRLARPLLADELLVRVREVLAPEGE